MRKIYHQHTNSVYSRYSRFSYYSRYSRTYATLATPAREGQRTERERARAREREIIEDGEDAAIRKKALECRDWDLNEEKELLRVVSCIFGVLMQSHLLLLRHDLYQGLVQDCSDTRVAARAEPHSLLAGVSVIKVCNCDIENMLR